MSEGTSVDVSATVDAGAAAGVGTGVAVSAAVDVGMAVDVGAGVEVGAGAPSHPARMNTSLKVLTNPGVQVRAVLDPQIVNSSRLR